MNNLAVAGAMATAPSTAFAELRERPRFWFPLLLILATTVAVMYWYYSAVDIDWLKDLTMGNNPDIQKMPEAQRAQVMAMTGRGMMLTFSVVGVVLGLPIWFLIQGLYFLVAAKITKIPLGFKHWFVLGCWTALPIVLNSVVAAIFIAISANNQMTPGVLQPLSLDELVLHRPIGSPGQTLFASLTIPGVLSWILMIIGVHTWSKRSWVFSSIVVMLPIVLVFGIWAAVAFR